MMRKTLVALTALILAAGLARAEPNRLLLSTENRMPELGQLEAGLVFDYVEIPGSRSALDDYNQYVTAPYLRFGLLENLTVFGRLPYAYRDPDIGDSTDGLGDASVGFELVAFEDTYRFPYIIPHAEVSFDTGDEKKGLGAGETLVTLGASVGTTVDEVFHYVADIRYTIGSDIENFATVSGAFIWDLSKRFSLLVEGSWKDLDFEDESYRLFFQGGMAYKATEALRFAVYGGAGDVEDVSASFKVSYSF